MEIQRTVIESETKVELIIANLQGEVHRHNTHEDCKIWLFGNQGQKLISRPRYGY